MDPQIATDAARGVLNPGSVLALSGALNALLLTVVVILARAYNTCRNDQVAEGRDVLKEMFTAIGSATQALRDQAAAISKQGDGLEGHTRATEDLAKAVRALDATVGGMKAQQEFSQTRVIDRIDAVDSTVKAMAEEVKVVVRARRASN